MHFYNSAAGKVAEGKVGEFPRKYHKGNSPQNSLIYLRLTQLRSREGGIIKRFSTIDVSIFEPRILKIQSEPTSNERWKNRNNIYVCDIFMYMICKGM